MNATDEEFGNLTGSIENCNGAAQDMQNIMLDNLKGDMDILKSAVSALGTSFGELIEGKLRGFAQSATDIVNSLNNMSDGTKNLLIDFTTFGAGIAAASTGIGLAEKGVASFLKACSSGTGILSTLTSGIQALTGASALASSLMTGGLLIAIAAVGFGLYELYNYVAKADERLMETNKHTIENMNNYSNLAKENANNVKTAKESLAQIHELEQKLANSKSAKEYEENSKILADAKSNIVKSMPELVSAYGSEENAINHLTDALKNYIKAQQEAEQNNKNLAAKEADKFFADNKKNVNEASKELSDYNGEIKDIDSALHQLYQLEDDERVAYGEGSRAKTTSAKELREELEKQKETVKKSAEDEKTYLEQSLQAYQAKVDAGQKLSVAEQKEYDLLKELASANYEVGDSADHVIKGYEGLEIYRGKSAKALREEVEALGELPEASGKAMDKMIKDFENGTINIDEGKRAIQDFCAVSKLDFGSLEKTAGGCLEKLNKGYSDGSINIKDYGEAVSAMSSFSAQNMGKLKESTQTAMTAILEGFQRGDVGAKDFAEGVKLVEKDMESFYNVLSKDSQKALDTLVQQFAQGNVTAQEFAMGMKMMEMTTSASFATLDKGVQQTMTKAIQQFAQGEITAQQFGESMGRSMGLSNEAISQLGTLSAESISNMVQAFVSGEASAKVLNDALMAIKMNPNLAPEIALEMAQINDSMKSCDTSTQELQDKLNSLVMNSNLSESAKTQMSQLIQAYGEGKISTEEFQTKLNELKANPDFASGMTDEINKVIDEFIKCGTTKDELQAKLDSLGLPADVVQTIMDGFNGVGDSAEQSGQKVEQTGEKLENLPQTNTSESRADLEQTGDTAQQTGDKVQQAGDKFGNMNQTDTSPSRSDLEQTGDTATASKEKVSLWGKIASSLPQFNGQKSTQEFNNTGTAAENSGKKSSLFGKILSSLPNYNGGTSKSQMDNVGSAADNNGSKATNYGKKLTSVPNYNGSGSVSNFNNVGSAASTAGGKVGDLGSKIANLKDKAITITTNFINNTINTVKNVVSNVVNTITGGSVEVEQQSIITNHIDLTVADEDTKKLQNIYTQREREAKDHMNNMCHIMGDQLNLGEVTSHMEVQALGDVEPLDSAPLSSGGISYLDISGFASLISGAINNMANKVQVQSPSQEENSTPVNVTINNNVEASLNDDLDIQELAEKLEKYTETELRRKGVNI